MSIPVPMRNAGTCQAEREAVFSWLFWHAHCKNSVIFDGGLAGTQFILHMQVDKDRDRCPILSLDLLTYLFYAMVQIHKEIIGSNVNNYMVIIFDFY